MPIKLFLSIERTTILCQENPLFRLQVSNTSSGAVTLGSPSQNSDLPHIRILQAGTGIEQIVHGHKPLSGTRFEKLPPDGLIDHPFYIRHEFPFDAPGVYDVSVLLPVFGEVKPVESNTVRVSVQPVTPRNLSLAPVSGGWSNIVYGATLNAVTDPPQVLRCSFEILPEGGVTDVHVVGSAPLNSSPILSVPKNQLVANDHWLGWRDGDSVVFTHFEDSMGASKPSHWKATEPDFVLVSPLVHRGDGESPGRPPGSALVWLGDPSRHLSSFQVLDLAKDGGITAGSRCPAGVSQPVWMRVFVRSDASRHVAFCQNTEKGATLETLRWPEGPGPSPSPRVCVTWPGTCHGGQVLLDAKDNLMGATLIRGPQKDGAKLRFIRWRIEDQTKYLEIGTHDVPWPFQSEISQSVLGVGPGGSACALLCDQEGQWSVFDPSGGFRKAPPSIAKTKFPLGLSYLNSADCVILSGQMQQGFRLMMLNGDPLPHLCG